jgi:hypothetical protein
MSSLMKAKPRMSVSDDGVAARAERSGDATLLVPPDAALLEVVCRVNGPSREKVRAERDRLASMARDDVAACDGTTIELTDRRDPHLIGDERFAAHDEWLITIDLEGLSSVDERAARIAAVEHALDAMAASLSSWLGRNREGLVQREAARVVVRDVWTHAPALIELERRRLAALQLKLGPGYAPEALRSVPTGDIEVVSRRLSGVELRLGVERQRQPLLPPMPPPPGTMS